MHRISAARLKDYRARTYRTAPARRIKTKERAIEFVNERGFIYFWPINGVELPSLWAAVAGARPVPNEHDDPGHVTWGWKDNLLGAKQWYYAKLLRGKATIVALNTLPYLYALSDNFGDYANDYLSLYAEGRLTADARAVYEALLDKGALHTVALRKEARMTSRDSNTRFEKALVELQTGLKILPIGVAQAGAWRYAFIYDIVDRFFPELPARAGPIKRAEAQLHLLKLYLASVGAATAKDVQRLFRWSLDETQRTVAHALATKTALPAESVAGAKGEWLLTPAITR
jgi:hypothetical protein